MASVKCKCGRTVDYCCSRCGCPNFRYPDSDRTVEGFIPKGNVVCCSCGAAVPGEYWCTCGASVNVMPSLFSRITNPTPPAPRKSRAPMDKNIRNFLIGLAVAAVIVLSLILSCAGC